jgi:hypothetical protein
MDQSLEALVTLRLQPHIISERFCLQEARHLFSLMALNHMQSLDRVDIYDAALELLVDVEDLLGCGEIISNDAEQF